MGGPVGWAIGWIIKVPVHLAESAPEVRVVSAVQVFGNFFRLALAKGGVDWLI